MALLNVKSEAPLGRGTACCSLIMHFRYFSVKWRNGSLLWPEDSVLCVVPLHVLSFAESIIFCCSQTARGLIVMVMTRPSSAGRALHTLAHNDSAVLVFKRWSAAGRRPSPGVSCSCGNLCHGTIERERLLLEPSLAHWRGEWRGHTRQQWECIAISSWKVSIGG